MRYLLMVFALVFCLPVFAEDDEPLTKPRAIVGKVGLISTSLAVYQRQNAQDDAFLEIKKEGFLLIGAWQTYMIGIRRKFEKRLNVQVGAGWYETRTFARVYRSGPSLSGSVSWEWKQETGMFWGIEAGGLGIAFLTGEKQLSLFAHLPAVYIGMRF